MENEILPEEMIIEKLLQIMIFRDLNVVMMT